MQIHRQKTAFSINTRSRFGAACILGLALTAAAFAAPKPELITVRPESRQQTIQGFGASIVGWKPEMEKYFTDPAFADKVANELGMSVFRVQIWDGNLPEEIADWHDITADKLQWDIPGARRGFINAQWARMMVKANPEVRIIGSVWSAPGWMKVSGKRNGSKAGFLLNAKRDYDDDNRLRPDRRKHFAKWLVEWARFMEAQGTPFYAISIQNEPMFTEPYESCMVAPDEYAAILQEVGEMFDREGVRRPLFYGPEDMTVASYNDTVRHRPYIDAILNSPAERYFDAFATHGYTDGIQTDSRMNPVGYWNSIKQFGRPYWVTEGGSGGHKWPEPVAGGIASRLHTALSQANVGLFTAWQVNGGAGSESEHNIMAGGQMTPKSYATMHFWRHIRPGAVRVDVIPPEDSSLLVSAYVDDVRGTSTTVLINTNPEPREVIVNWGNANPNDWHGWVTSATQSHETFDVVVDRHMAKLEMPGSSIITTVADWDRTRIEPLADPRWENEIKGIELREAEHPVPENGILFTGSSSIRMWKKVAEDFPDHPVFNRGFGGSQIDDLVGYFDRLVVAGHPRRIIVYSGTNDLNGGKSAERVIEDLGRFVDLVHEKLPGTTVAFISAAPNPRRWSMRDEYLRFNAMARVFCRARDIDYIDVWTPMLGEDGLPSRDIYLADQLHMNANGYVIWKNVVGKYLDK